MPAVDGAGPSAAMTRSRGSLSARARSISGLISFGSRVSSAGRRQPAAVQAMSNETSATTLAYAVADSPATNALHEARLLRVVRQLCNDSDEDLQNSAVPALAELIDGSTAAEAEAVGACVRECGALEPLLNLLDRPCTEQDALRIIGNLASNAVDPQAVETKRLLFELGAFPMVLRRIFSSSGPTIVYALGSVQNMCARREYALHMQQMGADARLRELRTATNASARHFATGCLSNMDAVLAPNFVPDPRLEPLSTPPRPSLEAAHAAAIAAERDAPQVVSQAALQSTADERRERSSGALCCAVCLDKAVNTALTPCFHAKFCNGCAVTIAFNRLPCPICRGQVNGLQRIYL